ncbi:MAG: acetylglutamate kinase [Dehalococcoidales bacterium]|nr:acetylglutamate kinase [Dehalococcoidales bacterium]
MNKPIVIKIGGATFGKHDPILEDLVALQKQGKTLVVIHGGGNMVTEWLKKQGAETHFVCGERVTDKPTLEIATAVLGGLANKQIVATINSLGGRAVGISGVDGALVQSRISKPELGYVGTTVKVDTAVLEALLKGGFIPVIASVSYYAFDRPADAPLMLNINGDPLAGEIAAALGAEKLIFLTDVAGVLDKNGKLLSIIHTAEVKELIDSGTASGGMIPKLNACLTAAANKTITCIVDGRQPHALINAIDKDIVGTTIRAR